MLSALRRTRDASLTRRFLSVSLLAFALVLSACGDDDDDPSGSSDDITGTWESTDGSQTYVVITDDEVLIFGEFGECYVEVAYEIVDVDEDEDLYELESSEGSFTVEIVRSGEDLHIEGEVFEESNVDVDDLEICEPLELPACSTLPELALGGSIDGELDEGDPLDLFEAHYEAYRIDLDSDTNIAIDMTSGMFDTYLVLYDDNETELAFNDDADDITTDSRIEYNAQGGCYIVMATSFSAGELGDYTISLSEF